MSINMEGFSLFLKGIKRTSVISIIAPFTDILPTFFKSFHSVRIFTYEVNPTESYTFLDNETAKKVHRNQHYLAAV